MVCVEKYSLCCLCIGMERLLKMFIIEFVLGKVLVFIIWNFRKDGLLRFIESL